MHHDIWLSETAIQCFVKKWSLSYERVFELPTAEEKVVLQDFIDWFPRQSHVLNADFPL